MAFDFIPRFARNCAQADVEGAQPDVGPFDFSPLRGLALRVTEVA